MLVLDEKACVVCGQQYAPTGKNSKYCSETCRRIVVLPKTREYTRKSRLKLGLIKHPDIPGTGKWQTKQFHYTDAKKSQCERCGSLRFLIVHHKDYNHDNDELNNLETLCRSCHTSEHDSWTGKKHTSESKLKMGAVHVLGRGKKL